MTIRIISGYLMTLNSRSYPLTGRELGKPSVDSEQIGGGDVFVNESAKHVAIFPVQRDDVFLVESLLLGLVEQLRQPPSTVLMQPLASVTPREVSISNLR